jgi:hypothetical protein
MLRNLTTIRSVRGIALAEGEKFFSLNSPEAADATVGLNSWTRARAIVLRRKTESVFFIRIFRRVSWYGAGKKANSFYKPVHSITL